MASPRVFGSSPSSLVVIDNYDSFTYNLVQQIERLSGARLQVLRNDCFDPAELLAQNPRAIVISPGPGTPDRETPPDEMSSGRGRDARTRERA